MHEIQLSDRDITMIDEALLMLISCIPLVKDAWRAEDAEALYRLEREIRKLRYPKGEPFTAENAKNPR